MALIQITTVLSDINYALFLHFTSENKKKFNYIEIFLCAQIEYNSSDMTKEF